MASETDIMNMATVAFLGSDHLMDRDEQDKNTRIMNLIYNPILEKLQREYAWNFCAKSAKLSALVDVPSVDYRYAYQSPTDCLLLISLGDIILQDIGTDYDPRINTAPYRIEGRRILTDMEAPLSIRYRARVTDAAQFDPAFADALACMLAIRSCKSITGKDTLVTSLRDQFRDIISGAIMANAIEKPSEKFPASSWMLARL